MDELVDVFAEFGGLDKFTDLRRCHRIKVLPSKLLLPFYPPKDLLRYLLKLPQRSHTRPLALLDHLRHIQRNERYLCPITLEKDLKKSTHDPPSTLRHIGHIRVQGKTC